jgi:predicted nucleic acid-binding protein
VKKRLYFDTSVLIKEFVPEVGSDLVDKVTTTARQGNIQIISSVWVVNETISVIDRLSRQKDEKTKKTKLSKTQKQQIIATLAERVTTSHEEANFFFQPMDHAIISNSRFLIDTLHIRPVDAMHLYTGWIRDCDYFLVHDKKLVKRIPSKQYDQMKIIDLGNKSDRNYLESRLQL